MVVIIMKENRLMIIAAIYNVIWHIGECLSCISAHVGSISDCSLDFNQIIGDGFTLRVNVNPSPIISSPII